MVKKSKFGECLNVTLQVEDGNLGNLEGANQNEMGGVAGLMASIDQEEMKVEDEYEERYEDLDIQELDFD